MKRIPLETVTEIQNMTTWTDFFEYDVIKKRLHYLKHDILNRWKYGSLAPYFGEIIFVNPQKCNLLQTYGWSRKHSGDVAGGDWDKNVTLLMNDPKFKFCIQHWVDGVPWKDTGAYEFMLNVIDKRGAAFDNCTTLQDIVKRYEELDRIFETVAKTGELFPQKVLNKNNFREIGGVFFHIDRNNKPIFGGGGIHRFAMSKILKFSCIPAQIGVVHKDALPDWQIHKQPLK